jgi:FG-GAP repeat
VKNMSNCPTHLFALTLTLAGLAELATLPNYYKAGQALPAVTDQICSLTRDQHPCDNLPTLQGEAAIKHLKKQAGYNSLKEAIAAVPYGIEYQKQSAAAGLGTAYQAANYAQSLRAYFTPSGMNMSPRVKQTGDWQVRIKLVGYGYGSQLRELTTGELKAEGNRIEYRRQPADGPGEIVTEWYVNRSSGLEQGFTIPAPPGLKPEGALLRLALALSGDLQASLEADGQAVVLKKRGGRPLLRYDKLHAFDARGRDLPAHMTVQGDEVSLVVDDLAAVYPVTIDPTFTQQAKLVAMDGAPNDEFGWSVATDGDTVVVGTWQDDNGTIENQGSVYIFTRSGANWIQQQKLTASDGERNDQFGYSVAISGDTLVVGANLDQIGTQSSQGSAYVFTRSVTSWSQQAKLTASDGASSHIFGTSVAISGDTIAVGARNAGAVYAFVRSGGGWVQQQKLSAGAGGLGGYQFGYSVAIDGDTIVGGARSADIAGRLDQGAAYVFVRSGTTWSLQQQLLAGDGAANEFFGNAVSISSNSSPVTIYSEISSAGRWP